jgi:hypothetical protein
MNNSSNVHDSKLSRFNHNIDEYKLQRLSEQLNTSTSKRSPGLSALFNTERRTFGKEARAENVRVALALPLDAPENKKVTNQLLEISKLNIEKHAHILLGPKVNVVADNNLVIRKDVPLRALAASCKDVRDLLEIKRNVTQFRVNRKRMPSQVDHKSVKRLLDLLTTRNITEATGFKLESDDLISNLLMYQACIALGVYDDYAVPLLRKLKSQVSTRLLTIEERNTIINRVRASNPLIEVLAHNLCHNRIKKKIDDIKDFEQWLAHKNRKDLREQMVMIDQGHNQRRKVNKHERELRARACDAEK